MIEFEVQGANAFWSNDTIGVASVQREEFVPKALVSSGSSVASVQGRSTHRLVG